MIKPKKRTPRRYFQATNFIRFLWTPRVGDRIYIEGTDKETYHKATVKSILDVKGVGEQMERSSLIQLHEFEGEFTSLQLLYRPGPEDYKNMIQKFPAWIYLEETDTRGQWIGCLKINQGQMYLKGKPYQILMDLLRMREVDIRINNAVNQLVQKVQGDLPRGNVRIHHQQVH